MTIQPARVTGFALPAAAPHPSTASWRAACLVLCLLGALIGGVGMADLPLDSHEVFVAQTTREMSLRGDWVVPWFNGEPRLNKPPMSYWLAGGVAALAGDLPAVAPWHVRAVSVLAGIGVIVATLWLGSLSFDRATGLLAAALVTASAGLFSFMHDARPDLLYACWVMLAIAAARAAQRHERPPLAGALGAMWIFHAAAVLTKGPHIPALVLLGTAVWLWRSRGSARAAAIALRPLVGLGIVLALCAPWWLAVAWRLDAAALEASQLGGTLLKPQPGRLGDPYYLYRPLQLMLPWLPLALGACLLALRQRAASELAPLWWPLLVTVAGLSLGAQYRYFYLLPLIGVMAVLVARPLLRGQAAHGDRLSRICLRATLVLQAGIVLAAAGWVLWIAAAGGTLPFALASLALGAVGAASAWRWWTRHVAPAGAAVVALAVGFAFVWPAATATGKPWSAERYASHALAVASGELGPEVPRATLGVSPTLFVYYTARPVRELEQAGELPALIAASPVQAVALVTRSTRLGELDASFTIEEIARAPRGGADDVLLLVGRGESER